MYGFWERTEIGISTGLSDNTTNRYTSKITRQESGKESKETILRNCTKVSITEASDKESFLRKFYTINNLGTSRLAKVLNSQFQWNVNRTFKRNKKK